MRRRVLVDPVVAYQDTSNGVEYQNRAFSLVGQLPITRVVSMGRRNTKLEPT